MGIASAPEGGDEQPQQQKQRLKAYQGLGKKTVDGKDGGVGGHGRNRSQSEHVPEGLQLPRPRHSTVSTFSAPPTGFASSYSETTAAAVAAVPETVERGNVADVETIYS